MNRKGSLDGSVRHTGTAHTGKSTGRRPSFIENSPDMTNNVYKRKKRGSARLEYKEIYASLLQDYLSFRPTSQSSQSFILSKNNNKPVNTAVKLGRLYLFSLTYPVDDASVIHTYLDTAIQVFESSWLHRFEIAYDAQDIQTMKQAANVIYKLNGAQSCMQVFTGKHPLFYDNRHDPRDNFQ